MVEDTPDSVRGMALVLALVAILLMIPIGALLMGAVRRAGARRRGGAARPDRASSVDAWTEAGRRGKTPSAAELDRQFGDGQDGGAE